MSVIKQSYLLHAKTAAICLKCPPQRLAPTIKKTTPAPPFSDSFLTNAKRLAQIALPCVQHPILLTQGSAMKTNRPFARASIAFSLFALSCATQHAHAADWRWLMYRSDCPWYPSFSLFRQPMPGQWQPVMEQIQQALLTFAALSSDES